jgi:hypothetical protein
MLPSTTTTCQPPRHLQPLASAADSIHISCYLGVWVLWDGAAMARAWVSVGDSAAVALNLTTP